MRKDWELVVVPTLRRYSDVERERAMRIVFQRSGETGRRPEAIAMVAQRLEINRRTLARWVAQAEADVERWSTSSTARSQQTGMPGRESDEQHREREIWRRALVLLAREIDL